MWFCGVGEGFGWSEGWGSATQRPSVLGTPGGRRKRTADSGTLYRR